MCTPQCICEKLGGLGFEEAIKAWKYVRHYTENLQKLQVKLRDLVACTATITREVSEAIGRDDEIEDSVSHWRTDADSLKDNIEQLIRQRTTKASISCIACSCPNIVWRYKFSKQAEEKMADADALIVKYNDFNHQISHRRSHYMENFQKLKGKLRDLDDCRETITREVSEANGRGDEIEVNVLHWQTDTGSLKGDIEQLIGESANICSTECPCPDITWQYNFSNQAEEKMAGADALIVRYNDFKHKISHRRSHYMENFLKLKVKLRDLDDCRETITREVSEANGRGDEIEVNVSHWQTDACSLKDDIEQLIRESANICSTECPCPDITWQYEFSKQAEEKIAAADELIIKYNNFNHQISHPRPRPSELQSLSDKNYVNFDSRASIFKDIMDALKDSNVNMIGVFGLGGVGKTTLVKEVGEQMRKDGTFKQVAIAAVSENLNVKEVQSRLAASLNFKFKAEGDDQVGRATELWYKLTNGDKYLIILDDIWQEVKMEEIGIPCTNEKKGCKVVLTSRNENLLSTVMEVDRNFPIAILSSAEAWTLFMKKVGNSIKSQPKIKSLANKVCERCKGLPVAINALGEALKGKQEHAWKTALDKLDKYMLKNIVGINPSVFASLKVSYDMLHPADAKSCFLLCCLFAEDAEIPLDELTRFWFAGSFLAQKPCTLEEARNDVYTVVDALKSASLLSNGNDENVVKIHDVIRDVGISIAREEEAFLVDHRTLRWPQNPPNGPSYSAISLIFKNVNEHPDGLEYPKLHTLTVVNSEHSDLEFPDNFFNGMMQLTVLTISGIRMRRLPSSLAKLKNLRMLYLNKCKLDDIAILKDLKSNLEVLSLSHSSIRALPSEIGQLTSLRVLDLRDCLSLTVIPRGVISNLTSLEELYFPTNFDEWGATTDKPQDTSSEDNASLEELRWLLKYGHLTTLHIHIPNVELLPKEDLKFADLKRFRISVGSEFSISEAYISRTCMLKLEGIQLRNEFIPLVDKAEVLVLKLESSMHPLRLFNKLTVLIIKHFKLKYLFSPTTARGLIHLEVLKVTSCEIMEGIVGFEEQKDKNETTGEVKFSKLEQLKLKSLPNLISFFAKKEEMGTTMGSFSARAQPLFNELVAFPVLNTLSLKQLDKITRIWDNQPLSEPEKEAKSYSELQSILVESCEHLEYVLPFYMLPQLKNDLCHLDIKRCRKMEVIISYNPKEKEATNNNDTIRFPKFSCLELEDLPNLKCFVCSETQLFFSNKVIFPVLKILSIRKVHKIIEIWDKQSIAVLEEQGSFCQLIDLDVSECEKLMHVFPSKMHSPLKNLKVLRVSDCPTMEGIVEFEGEMDDDGIRNEVCFSKLSSLELSSLPNLESFCTKLGKVGTTEGYSIIHALPLFYGKVAFPVLETLKFKDLHKLTRIWDNQPLSEPQKEAKSFCKLMVIKVEDCNQLEHVLPLYMLPQLKNLQNLTISGCTKMEVIISNNLKEKEATNNDTIRFPQLKKVELWDSPNLKSFICSETQLFFSNKVIFPVLKKLSIRKVHKIIMIWDKQSISVLEEQGSFSQLTDLDVSECEKLMHVFPSKMHSPLKSLKVLRVSDCPTMEGIVEFEGERDEDGLRNEICFSELSSLELSSLPNLESFYNKLGKAGTTEGNSTIHALPLFNEKVIFPMLKKLSIRKVHKIIEIWDKQSIAVLEEQGSFCQLTDLDVSECAKLMHVFPSKMHSPLKNLKVLRVSDCPTMEGIVEFEGEMDEDGLSNEVCFSELSSLELSSLPNLESFCTKLGKAGTTEGNSTIHALPLFNEKVIFPVLKKLSIRKVHKIIMIWDKQSISVLEEQGSFSQLTDLDVSECEKLMHVFPSKMHSPLKSLKVLRVSDCSTMEGIVEFEGERDEDGLRNEICFSELSSLELSSLPNLESFYNKLGKAGTTEGNSTIHALPLFNEKIAFPVLESLKFGNLSKITRIWDEQPLSEQEKEAKSFCKLQEISVEGCNQLEYVLPFYMLPQSKNLRALGIGRCRKMEVIISNNPKEKEATNNNDTIWFPQLKYVKLEDLPNLKSFCSDETQLFFSNKVAFPVLEILKFKDLHKLSRIWDEQPLSEQEKEAKSSCKLQWISVKGCNQLEYVLPFNMLPQLKNLQGLSTKRCRKMEVIISNNPKEKETTTNNDTIRFPQLYYVNLEDLPNLKSFCSDETQLFFSNKVAFPVLEILKFKDLHKLSRIWDEQPLSEQEKEAKSSCKLLWISVKGCNQLEYVLPFNMLPQLKNLQGLSTKRCRKMEVIISNNPKEKEATNNNDAIRFPLLKYVKLEDLPNLKSFCSDETQLFFSNKDAFPVLKIIYLDKDSEFLQNETSTKEVSIEECGTSGKESDYNCDELDEDLETPTKEECSTSGKGNDHNGAELDEDLETPTKKVSMKECGTSGPSDKENDHNGEQG